MKKLVVILISMLSFESFVSSQTIPIDSMYLGQIPPWKVRKIFSLGVDPGYSAVEKIAISPDGKEIYYEETNSNWTSYWFKYYKYYNNHWNGPVNLFAGFYCLSLSPDGNFMYFENNNYNDCWISVKQGTSWDPPAGFLQTFNVHSLNNTGLNNYYMSSNPAGGLGQRDICKLIAGNPDTSLVGLGRLINSSANEGDFFISNDESFIIIMSNRSGGFGSTDLYISYRKSYTDDTWTNPKNMGASVNTSGDDFGPYITADSKYLFYESGYSSTGSIYWVRIDSLIDSLMHTNFIPYLKYSIPDQTGTVGNLFDFTIPDGTFIDDDGNNILIYQANLIDGSPLPSWLTFDTISATFSGTPEIVQTLNIRVKATDTAGASASATFKIVINPQTDIDNTIWKGVRFFPNPTSGLISISSDAFSDKLTIVEISNIEGKVILINSFTNDISIDLTSRPKGIYVMKLILDNEVITSKICLE
jgi:hypothetical protein